MVLGRPPTLHQFLTGTESTGRGDLPKEDLLIIGG